MSLTAGLASAALGSTFEEIIMMMLCLGLFGVIVLGLMGYIWGWWLCGVMLRNSFGKIDDDDEKEQ